MAQAWVDHRTGPGVKRTVTIFKAVQRNQTLYGRAVPTLYQAAAPKKGLWQLAIRCSKRHIG